MFFNFSIIAAALAAMSVSVEAAPAGGRGGRGGSGRGGRAGEHAGNVIGGAGTAAGFIPSTEGKHVAHNCCVNDGGWQYNKRAHDLTVKVCNSFSSAQMYNNACTEAAGSGSISGDAFYNACKNQAPGDDSVGAGYRATC